MFIEDATISAPHFYFPVSNFQLEIIHMISKTKTSENLCYPTILIDVVMGEEKVDSWEM